jgi:hypothetical protein
MTLPLNSNVRHPAYSALMTPGPLDPFLVVVVEEVRSGVGVEVCTDRTLVGPVLDLSTFKDDGW